jgi:hypothetical protein
VAAIKKIMKTVASAAKPCFLIPYPPFLGFAVNSRHVQKKASEIQSPRLK